MPLTAIATTIPQGDSISNAVDCTSGQVVRIYLPDDWIDSPLTLEVSWDNIQPYRPVYRPDGTRVEIVMAQPGSAILFPDDIGKAIGWLKLRAGTDQKPIVQPQAATVTLVLQTGGPAGYATPQPVRKKARKSK